MWEYLVDVRVLFYWDCTLFLLEYPLLRGKSVKARVPSLLRDYPIWMMPSGSNKIWQGSLLKFSCWVCDESSYLIFCPLLACLCCGFILGHAASVDAIHCQGCHGWQSWQSCHSDDCGDGSCNCRSFRSSFIRLSENTRSRTRSGAVAGTCGNPRRRQGARGEGWCVAANDRQVVAST